MFPSLVTIFEFTDASRETNQNTFNNSTTFPKFRSKEGVGCEKDSFLD